MRGVGMRILKSWLRLGAFLGAASFVAHASVARAGEAAKAPRLAIGYSSITGNRIPLWVAQDLGFFARYGIATDLIFIATSAYGIPALVSGNLPIFSGSPETAAQAAANGVDLLIFASAPPTPYKLISQPQLKTVDDLKGKKIGIDRIGGSSYYATRRMLQKLGVRPESVEFIQVAGGGAQRVAAFRSGMISAVVSTIERFERERVPHFILADAIEMGVRVIGSSYTTTSMFLGQNREAVQKFTRALIDVNQWCVDPKNKDAVLRVAGQRLKTSDADVLELNYRMYVAPLPLFPLTHIDDLRTNLADFAEANPKLKELKLTQFVDNSFIQRVQQEMKK
jgi:ABC-type nitrate/sulfonate/bicarbonate transport system substrate-binding protein